MIFYCDAGDGIGANEILNRNKGYMMIERDELCARLNQLRQGLVEMRGYL